MTWDRFTESEAATFEATLRAQLGTAWRHMGRKGCGYGHQTGLDCVGLAIVGALAIGRPVADLEATARARTDGSKPASPRISARLRKASARVASC